MSAERTRANLLARVLLLEIAQDVLTFAAQITSCFVNLFTNLGHTCKIAEIDAAKQYRDLTGSAVREINGSLAGSSSPPEAG